MSTRTEVFDMGNTVLCDFCNKDWTFLEGKGGVLFGSYAVCPDCMTDEWLAEVERLGETEYISQRCPDHMEFRKWVWSLRGGQGGKIEITILE